MTSHSHKRRSLLQEHGKTSSATGSIPQGGTTEAHVRVPFRRSERDTSRRVPTGLSTLYEVVDRRVVDASSSRAALCAMRRRASVEFVDFLS